jgi:hypothetical protein
MESSPKASSQQAKERDALPLALRPIFDQLVAEYKFACFEIYGREFVAYKVLAALVRSGWQPPNVP